MTSEPPAGVESPNETFLSDTRRTKEKPIFKQVYPETSNQEIGWFAKVQPSDSFRTDTRVSRPKVYSDLSRYMDTYWSYYPPPIAKFHPKDK